MQEVQRIVERTTLYTLLPGWQAIIGGVLALVGCGVSWSMMGSLDFQRLHDLSVGNQVTFCIVWAIIVVVAITQDVVITAVAARKQGISPMARPARFAALSLTPSVFVAVVLTVKVLLDGHLQYVAPAWIMCYGTGVYSAGLFSVRLPRLLGMAFIAIGTIGLLLFPDYGVVLVAVSFGLLHVVFGAVVLRRTRLSDQT